ncbi:MAG: flagellar assembly protein FliW [Oligoflexia bacterium]|nr:flagellar assembly protein FliW [Oligoflexia bacterium]
MQFQTTRFGLVAVQESDLITFKEGPLGFTELTKFVLLDDPKDEIFAWLQSVEKPSVAFPVLEPELFASNYKVSLTRHDLESLSMKAGDKTRMYNIVTIPEDATLMTANLKAPIVINVRDRVAKQVVAQENDYPIRFPIFAELQRRVVQNPALPLKNLTTGSANVAVKLTAPNAKKAPEANA